MQQRIYASQRRPSSFNMQKKNRLKNKWTAVYVVHLFTSNMVRFIKQSY